MITKRCGKDFGIENAKYSSYALTLSPDDLGTHDDGWTVEGAVIEDYYQWVNDFEASHPVFGRVWGNFEDEVFADSEEGFDHFYEHHTPQEWDYYDI